jgi:hypothetical protein
MRKAAAVLFILATISALTAGALPDAASERKGTSSSLFAFAGSPEMPGFSLAGSAGPLFPIGAPSLDLPRDPGDLAIAEKRPEVPAPALKNDLAAPRLSVSFFIGAKGGDIFASLHRVYAWKPMSRSLTVGLGLYREIPIFKGIGLMPYVGIIRASATLSLAGLHGNRETFESELTAFCVGLPLVLRFN